MASEAIIPEALEEEQAAAPARPRTMSAPPSRAVCEPVT